MTRVGRRAVRRKRAGLPSLVYLPLNRHPTFVPLSPQLAKVSSITKLYFHLLLALVLLASFTSASMAGSSLALLP